MTDPATRLKAALADRCAIQEELGAGGMATVYLAEDLKHHRKVAVKVLRPEASGGLVVSRPYAATRNGGIFHSGVVYWVMRWVRASRDEPQRGPSH